MLLLTTFFLHLNQVIKTSISTYKFQQKEKKGEGFFWTTLVLIVVVVMGTDLEIVPKT